MIVRRTLTCEKDRDCRAAVWFCHDANHDPHGLFDTSGHFTSPLLLALNEKIKIVEVHPGAVMALRGAPAKDAAAFKINMISRRKLLEWLEKQGLKKAGDIKNPSDHYVAACAAALAAWKWYQHKSVWIFEAEQPFHPFDSAC